MLINTILGNIKQDNKWQGYLHDYLELEWYELNKRLLRKTSTNNIDIGISMTDEKFLFQDGDILGMIEPSVDKGDEPVLLVVKVKECECIAIEPRDNLELARICYDIGNRHAPLFIDEEKPGRFLLAMDKPLKAMLDKAGVETLIVTARLVNSLSNASHSPQSHSVHHH